MFASLVSEMFAKNYWFHSEFWYVCHVTTNVSVILVTMSQIGKVQCASSGNFLQISRKLDPETDYMCKKKLFEMLIFTTYSKSDRR